MNVILNGEALTADPGETVATLLQRLGLPHKGVAVERNLAIVPKSDYAGTALQAGDKLEIIEFVGGG